MRKENIDHFFKYGTFPYGEWFKGGNKATGKLPVATTLSLLDTVVVTRRRRRVTSFAFPSGRAPTGASLHLRLPLRRRRPGAEYADCIYGTDCDDCGPRFPRPPPICAETCNWASDADCNDCSPG